MPSSEPTYPATYKDLCVDAVDAASSGRFWGAVLGLDVDAERGNVVMLTSSHDRDTLWVNEVPEPHTVKNRLHVDVHTGSVAELVELGATVLDDTLPWTVMADPDGGEFCAFVRDHVPHERLYELVLDALDPEATARWWAGLLGGELTSADDGSWSVEKVPEAPFEFLVVSPTTEPKTTKNRVHVDVLTDAVDLVLAHGATLLRGRDADVAWDVLADPEGNEFCAFTR